MIRRLTLLLAIPAAMLPLPAQARKSQRATVMQAIGATVVQVPLAVTP